MKVRSAQRVFENCIPLQGEGTRYVVDLLHGSGTIFKTQQSILHFYYLFLICLTYKMQRRNTNNNLFEPIICIFQFLELNQHFQIPTSRTFWSSYNIQYFENYWSNTEGIDARIGNVIKINNQKQQIYKLRTAFSVVESNIITYYLKRKVSYYKIITHFLVTLTAKSFTSAHVTTPSNSHILFSLIEKKV